MIIASKRPTSDSSRYFMVYLVYLEHLHSDGSALSDSCTITASLVGSACFRKITVRLRVNYVSVMIFFFSGVVALLEG